MRGVEETDAASGSFEELLLVAGNKIKNCFSFIFSVRERAEFRESCNRIGFGSERNFSTLLANPGPNLGPGSVFHTSAKRKSRFFLLK